MAAAILGLLIGLRAVFPLFEKRSNGHITTFTVTLPLVVPVTATERPGAWTVRSRVNLARMLSLRPAW